MIRYQITNGLFGKDPAAWFETLRDDVDFIQIREKDLTGRELAELVRTVMASTRVRVLVNDRIDIAIACGAGGVHLRAGSVSPLRVKDLAPLVVTVSCHNEEDLASATGADYALLAPVFAPLSKPDHRSPLGLANLRRLAAASAVPVLALGGITPENAWSCVQAGAAGVAGISFAGRWPNPRI